MTAEELYNESLASDNDQWLFFQIEKVPASQQMEQLKMWLATNKPSQVSLTHYCSDYSSPNVLGRFIVTLGSDGSPSR